MGYGKAKYIVMEDVNGDKQPFIFPNTINHDHMARAVQRLQHFTVYSAGFVDLGYEEHPDYPGQLYATACPYGESLSLNVASKPDDKITLNKIMAPGSPFGRKSVRQTA